MLDVDWLDKAIVLELYGNARVSLQNLARKYDVSFNTIKKRVKKLEKEGVIQGYTVELSLNTLGAEMIHAVITTDGTEDIKNLIETIGNHRLIRHTGRYRFQFYDAQAVVCGTSEFFELKQFLENLPTVSKVELHPFKWILPDAPPQSKVRTRGKKVEFTLNQLRILQCLTEDVRMSVPELAKRTRLTPRRVRSILRELLEGGGVHFTVRMSWISKSTVALALDMRFDEKKVTLPEIVNWFHEQYPLEFWGMLVWLDEPSISASLNVADLNKVAEITQKVKTAGFAEFVEDLVVTSAFFASEHYRGPSQIRLDELFKEAGL